MAITRVAQTGFSGVSGVGPSTISHAGGICDAAFVYSFDTSLIHTVSSVTYGGVSMTKLGTFGAGTTRIVSIWGLQDCLTGTQDVQITGSNASYTGQIVVATYKGVSRTATFPDATNGGRTTSPAGVDNVQVSVTTTVDNCVLLGLGFHNGLAADEHSPGTNTSRFALYQPGTGLDAGALESDPFNTGTAGSKTMEITLGAINQELVLLVVAIAPSLTGNTTASPIII